MRRVSEQVYRLTGVHVVRTPPRGFSLAYDLKKHLPGLSVRLVFDVGANVGQSARQYVRMFPGAEIHCFEPCPETCRILRQRVKARVHELALSSRRGSAAIAAGETSDRNRVTEGNGVTLETLDQFCSDRGIDHVGFVKIDTEGHDLEVLKGAEALLAGNAIDLVQVEAGMHPDNGLHVPFETLKKHLEERGYRLFGIYDQAGERTASNLRRSNPVFVSAALLIR